VPGDEISNTLPPDILLLALGAAQTGLVLALEGPMRRLLDRSRVWAATVLVNGTIMTVYLWHLTVLALLVGLAKFAGGIGLRHAPGTADWWLARIPWLAALAAGMLLILPLAGAALVSAGIAYLTLGGIAADGGVGVRGVVVGATIVGAWLLGAITAGDRTPASAAT
jgi:hypothetical protein